MHILALDPGLFVPGLMVLGASLALSLYHLFLYIQYKEKIILHYSLYLFFLAAYIACYLAARQYYEDEAHHFIFYLKESMNIAAIVSYSLFMGTAVQLLRKGLETFFRIFYIVISACIVYCIFYILAGMVHLRHEFIFTSLPIIIRVLALSLALVAMPLFFFKMNEHFLRLIKWGAIIYLVIMLLIMIVFTTSGASLFGIHHMQLFFAGSLIDIIIFSLAMGYKVKAAFTQTLNIRNKISQDLHDEIGSALSGIKVFSQLAAERPETGKEYLEKISHYSDEMLIKMGDIVWSIQTENDSFDHLIQKLHNYALSVTAAKNIQLNFSADSDIRRMTPDLVVRKNIYLLAKEAINNAVKYSGCSALEVTLQWSRAALFLCVRDNGSGFLTNEITQGNGLVNMKRRAEEIHAVFELDTWPGKGTAVCVTINFT